MEQQENARELQRLKNCNTTYESHWNISLIVSKKIASYKIVIFMQYGNIQFCY